VIKVNDRFEFERDTYCWKLHDWKDGKNPKTGEAIRTKRTTYHANLAQVCRAVVDREAGLASDLASIVAVIERISKDLAIAINGASNEKPATVEG